MDKTAYHYVVHKESKEQAVRIQDGKFDGMVYQYSDDGNVIDPQDADEIPLTFKWKVLYNPNEVDLETGEFAATAGDILLELIEEGLENDAITVNTESGENYSPSFDTK